jgi:uncharacterized protein (UPF0276 family)
MKRSDFAHLGFGVGLRRAHYAFVIEQHPPVDWFEVISENFMVDGGRLLEVLGQVRSQYPVVLDGVSLSIGSADPLNLDCLHQLSRLSLGFEPAWIFGHLNWTGVGGHNPARTHPATLHSRCAQPCHSTGSGTSRNPRAGNSVRKHFQATWNSLVRL